MRVNPVELNSCRHAKQVLVIVLIIFGSLYFYLFIGRDSSSSNNSSKRKVDNYKLAVVLNKNIGEDELIEESFLSLEKLPSSLLGDDVYKSFSDVVGKYSKNRLPKGSPLRKSFLVDSLKEQESETKDVKKLEPDLEVLYPNTVAVTLPFLTVAPAPGSRIAISIQGDAGKSVLVAEEAFVQSVDGNFVQVRVASHLALFLEGAKSLGVFSSLVIPKEGDSPFLGQGVSDIFELKEKLNPTITKVNKRENKKENIKKKDLTPDSFSSYAWSNKKEVFAIDEKGRLHTINKNGKVSPLYPYKKAYLKFFKNK